MCSSDLIADGRLTHSVLDAYRSARGSNVVIVPFREPIGACASELVRHEVHDNVDAALRILTAHAAWHRCLLNFLHLPNVYAVEFSVVTKAPWLINQLIDDPEVLRSAEPDELADFESDIDRQLQDDWSQYGDSTGLPKWQILSIPQDDRKVLNERARVSLTDPTCHRALARAHKVFDRVLHHVRSLVSPSARS